MDAATGTVTWPTASTCCLQSPAQTAAGRDARIGVKERTSRNVSMITANIFYQNVQAVVNQATVTMCMIIEIVMPMVTAKRSAHYVAEIHVVALLGLEYLMLTLRNARVRSADISDLNVPAAVGRSFVTKHSAVVAI